MALNSLDLSFTDDSRGVSGVVGFVMIFAILMILLSINQAQVVPAENSKVEFQHFQDVRNDLVDVRSAILTAGQNDISQFPTVNLGTDYPPRILAVNPPPASGTLQTSEAYDIIIKNDTVTERIETRFMEYRPGYHELDVGSTWYENSMLYLDEREQSGLVVIEEQDLVPEGGDELRITALQNEYRESGSGRVALELYPSDTNDIQNLTGELEVTLPTRLTNEYWGPAFDDEPAFDPTVEDGPYPAGVQALNFTVQKEDLTINTVGVQSMPDGKSAKENVGIGENGELEAPDNPQSSDQVFVEGDGAKTAGSGNSIINFTLKNNGTTQATITSIAVNTTTTDATHIKNKNSNNNYELVGGEMYLDSNITIGGRTETLDTFSTIQPGSSETFSLGEFRDGPDTGDRFNMNNEDVVVYIVFSDDTSKKYTFAVST